MAPGPAMRGKATGTMEAPEPALSFLMNSRPIIISRASRKSTKAPATAKEAMSMPKRLSNASPAKKKARKRPKATLVAWSGLMCLPLSSIPMKMGMEPVISMMANITMKTLIISTKLIC